MLCELYGCWLGIIYLQDACPKVYVYCIDGIIYRVLGITDDVGELVLPIESLGLPSKHWDCSICKVHLKGTTQPFAPWARQKDAKLRWDFSHYYVHHYAF